VATAVLLVLVGVLTGELAVRVARQDRSDRTMSGNLGRVRQAASLLAHGEELVVLIGSVGGDLTRLLGLRDCWFAAEPIEPGAWYVDRSGEMRRSEDRGPVVRSAYRRSDQVALPVWGQGQVIGHFVLETPRRAELARSELLVAVTLADQVGAALIAQAPSIAWSSTPVDDQSEQSAQTSEPTPTESDPPSPHLRVLRDGPS
jgi:hypothetical protein